MLFTVNRKVFEISHCVRRRLVTGDSEGRLSVYGVDRSVAQPRNEDFTQFQERVRQFQPIPSRREAWSGLDARYAARDFHVTTCSR